MADSAKPRPMRYPYTLTAQIMQFPFKHYYDKSWIFKYWLFAAVIITPVFWKLQKMSNSDENKKIWHEKRKQLFEGGSHH